LLEARIEDTLEQCRTIIGAQLDGGSG
jgi:hypothetical protein